MGRLVLVSGAPGAGKSTLAAPLARSLGFPLLTKDTIKETLFDLLGPSTRDEREWSRDLGAAAMNLMWRLAADLPEVLIEANFRSGSLYERERLQELSLTPVEVYCRVPPEIAAERYNDRGSRPGHHPVHVVRTITPEALGEFQAPFGLGPVIEVDTTQAVDVEVVATAVRDALDHGVR